MPPLLSPSLTPAFLLEFLGVHLAVREHCEILDLLEQREDTENANPLLGLSWLLPMRAAGAVGVPMPDLIQLNKSRRT